MDRPEIGWRVRDKRKLLLTMMELLAGNARISFEGRFDNVRLRTLPSVSDLEMDVLKRCTLYPEMDFLVVPLEQNNIKAILSALGGSIPNSIIHIQIEKAGRIEFGAYDNFHPMCVCFGCAIDPNVIKSLVASQALKVVASRGPE